VRSVAAGTNPRREHQVIVLPPAASLPLECILANPMLVQGIHASLRKRESPPRP
jgi:hypothetical protein